jgi:alpha-tubulin suppressor-like RCC1 family protein
MIALAEAGNMAARISTRGILRAVNLAALVLFAITGPVSLASAQTTGTSTTLTSSLNPSAFGQSVTFTSRVSPLTGAIPPTGEVTFTDTTTGAVLGTRSLLAPALLAKLDAGSEHTCSLAITGGVYCWGANLSGQIGDGTTTDRLTPVRVSGLSSGFADVAAGGSHSCALTTAGAVLCWGFNTSGQLGDGTVNQRNTPVPVTGLSSGVAAIVMDENHSCALTTAGAVLCWGENQGGQIGDGTTINRLTPVPVSGLSSGVVAIATGDRHSCALTNAGAVLCWGSNNAGQLGDGTTTDRLTPVPVSGLSSGVAAISVGNSTSCALTGARVVLCWGDNFFGQIGDGTTINRLTPVSVSGLSGVVTAISVGGPHICALTSGGAIQCWGLNVNGALGDGTTTDRRTPVFVSGLSGVVAAVAAGGTHSCALTTGGVVLCWGFNSRGQLGDSTTTTRLTPVTTLHPQDIAATVETDGLAVGLHAIQAVYLGNAGFLGSSSSVVFQLVNKAPNTITFPALSNREFGTSLPALNATTSSGLPVTYASTTATVCTVTSGSFITMVSVGTCSITASQPGNANFLAATSVTRSFSVTRGANTITFPALPNTVFGTTPPLPVATASSGLPVTYASTTAPVCTMIPAGVITLVAGGTCSITASQAGNATYLAATPVVRSFSVTQAATAITVASSRNPSVFGQSVSFTARVTSTVGFGSPTGSVTITDTTTSQVLGTTALTAINQTRLSAGSGHTCSVASDGGAWCWGFNDRGQLGDGTTTNRLTPVAVSGLSSGVTTIAAGSSHSCALTTAGAVLCWGLNNRGQLGDGTTTNRLTPVPVSGLSSGVAAISVGNSTSCALTGARVVLCWGDNFFGQIGDGTTINRLTPVPVSGLSSGVAAISLGSFHSCAVTTAGAVRCWGVNSNGQLGDGTTTNRPTPVPVSGLSSGFAAVSGFGENSCARSDVGAVRCWGDNAFGQIGDGSTIDRLTPVTVATLSSGVVAVATGGGHSCAVTTAGAVRCWGKNTFGQIGDGSTIDRFTPVAVPSLSSGVAAISLGNIHSCALTTAGAVRCWGGNGEGQLGDGTTTSLATAVATRHPGVSRVSVSTSGLAAGAHAIRASYAGNATFLASTSALLTQTVNKGATTTALASSATSVTVGASVTLTATVGVVAPVSATPSGRVTFFRAGNIAIGTAAVSAGKALLATNALPAGANSITARYDVAGADPRLLTSTSVAVAVTVTKRASTTLLTASKNPVPLGTAVTFTATVGAGATGNVVFKNGATTLATIALSNGAASTTFTPNVAGTLPITAAYAGDASFNASTSAALKLLAHVPCSDAFASAPALAGTNGSAFGTTAGATGETGEPNHAGNSGALNSVWCRWTAPAAGTVTIDTTGSSFDTTLGVYTGTSVSALTQVAANDNIGPGNTRSRVTFNATAGTVYRIAIDGVSATGAYVVSLAQAAAVPTTFASVLPTARSIRTGATATAFATMINTGAVPATACSLSAPPGFPANFSYQITNASNSPTGTPDTPQTIAAGAAQSFFFAVTPLIDLNSSELAIVFDCANTPTTVTVPGLNTLLLSASSTPSPDLISIGSTPSGDGIANIPGATGSTAFGAATVNIGAAGTITASVDDNGKGLALTASLCVTNPTTGACTNPATPAATATFALAANASATVAVFVTGTGNVPFDPGANRLFLRFKTADGVTRGATSVAVRTQ